MARKLARNKSQDATKSAAKSAASVPAKITQPHGGALLAGGMPGNAGGGRTPNHVRQMAVEIGISKALPKLEAILDDQTSTKQEIIAAAREVLGAVPRKDEAVLTDHPEWTRRMDALRSALLEIVGEETATQVILRADELARAVSRG